MPEYFLTNKAVEDLSEIWEYSVETWSAMQAEKYYDLLIQMFRKIAESPGLGKEYKAIENNLFGLKVGQHIIFYLRQPDINILVLRILHVRMDLKNKNG